MLSPGAGRGAPPPAQQDGAAIGSGRNQPRAPARAPAPARMDDGVANGAGARGQEDTEDLDPLGLGRPDLDNARVNYYPETDHCSFRNEQATHEIAGGSNAYHGCRASPA